MSRDEGDSRLRYQYLVLIEMNLTNVARTMSPYGAYTAQDKSMNQFSCTHFHCSTLSFTPTDQTLYMTDYGGMVNVYAGDIMMKYVADLEPGEGGHIVKMSSFPVKRSPKDNIALSNHHQ